MKRWTVLYYISYNNSLSAYLKADLLRLVGNSPSTGHDVIYHFLISLPSKITHLRLQGALTPESFSNQQNIIKTYKQNDTPIHDMLKSFINTAQKKDPAQQYAFFYNGGGCGTYLHIKDPNSPQIWTRSQRLKLTLPQQWQIATEYFLGASSLKSICYQLGIHFAIMAFDACVMSTLEASYELRHCTDLIIASEHFEGAMGLNSSQLISLFANPQLSPLEICKSIASNYISRTNDQVQLHMGDTMTDSRDSVVIDTRYLPSLVGHLIAFQEIFDQRIQGYNLNDINNAWVDTEISELFALVDLYTTIIQQKQRLAKSKNNLIKFSYWLEEFKFIWNQVVVAYFQNNGLKHDRGVQFHGLSYLIDPNIDNWSGSSLYAKLELSQILDHVLLKDYTAYLH
jgi:hypothetical protein